MINFDPIEPNLFIGSAPQSSVDVERLKKLKLSAIISLQSDQDFVNYRINWDELQNAYQDNDMLVQRYPIMDFDEADLGQKVALPIEALNSLLKVGHRVYVHCNAGICRAPATVLGYLCHYRGMTLDQGLAYIRQHRPQVNPYRKAVETALEALKQ